MNVTVQLPEGGEYEDFQGATAMVTEAGECEVVSHPDQTVLRTFAPDEWRSFTVDA